ncbi:MAG: hypothetical protein MJB14_14835 [Spirochaetes bacterium]|nr:hypothetical protein [Spirochaetota bacterium]
MTKKTHATKKKKKTLADYQDEIAKQAFLYYEIRLKDNIPGTELDDWIRAEEDIKAKYNL